MKKLLLCGAVVCLACGGEGKQSADTGTPAATPAATAAPAGGATITGTVKFTGTAPANPPIDMAEEPTCRTQYTAAPTDPVVAVRNGNLQNVFVSVSSGLPGNQSWPAPATTATLDQQGCLYTPRVLGVMAGQPLRITNSDAVLHNIKAVPKVNRGFNISQPTKGMETSKTFDRAEDAIPMECNVHGWMHGKVFVLPHPFFAVSNSDGTFTIGGLPAGTYTLTAWHETLGTKTATVTVAADGAGTAAFTFGG